MSERFVIKKIIKGFTTTNITISEKTKEEYIEEIAAVIHKECNNLKKRLTSKSLAKAVADRLFGEVGNGK
jgi:hypothetical protein